jgi:lysylphosphatidylglycerol synthetase-like protein (DUF2156 family)
LLGGWLAFDGVRALTVGDYITPASGAHAGQLGPWSRLVAAIGIEPRSPLMKAVHVALGLLWLVAVAGFAARVSWAWWAVLACAMASFWYLPIGTGIGIIELILLVLPSLREGGGRP